MAYCLIADVQAYFKNTTFTSGSSVTDTEINTWIDQYSEYIDSRIGDVYVTPITGTKALKIVKIICAKFVAGEADEVLREGKAIIDPKAKESRDLKKEAEDMLNMIRDEDIVLSDAVVQSSSNLTSYNKKNNIEPVFEKEMEF